MNARKFLGNSIAALTFFLASSQRVEASENVDLVANFSLEASVSEEKINEALPFYVRSLWVDFPDYVNSYYRDNIQKVLLMNAIALPKDLKLLPREKLVLFLWEPEGADASYCNAFSKVYTVNHDLIDGVKYFPFFYPVLMDMSAEEQSFENRKLCTLVSFRATQERIHMVRFFESKPEEDFEFYGFKPIVESNRYRGALPGVPWSNEKVELLKKYRFSICFENSYLNGYITEKIFTCFAAGCVPIYLGAPNVKEYIPKECFIDYRNFSNDEELYRFIKEMPEKTYQTYLDHIRAFLKSDSAQLFSQENFIETLKRAIAP